MCFFLFKQYKHSCRHAHWCSSTHKMNFLQYRHIYCFLWVQQQQQLGSTVELLFLWATNPPGLTSNCLCVIAIPSLWYISASPKTTTMTYRVFQKIYRIFSFVLISVFIAPTKISAFWNIVSHMCSWWYFQMSAFVDCLPTADANWTSRAVPASN